ncbi:MAG: sigma-70 family RNA polymerase sigma factor, partial [Chloroflexi bacterium]|nr:sigma-70 family RNA polymerase sigma factor [Chloroflexota bacterium]MCI0818609.1 sigma-70 family RNA polymerase sigma factor [Chloroflexota bacterium]
MSPNSDAQAERLLVDAAKAGDQAALSELYQTYFPRLYRYILARTGNTYDAEDLTEEVFMRVLEAIKRFEHRKAPFSAWLFRIAHNAVISQRRKETARGRSSQLNDGMPVDSAGPEELVEKRVALSEVMQAAKSLPDAQRQVISLRFAAGLTVAETARAMGKGEGNV